MLHSVRDNYLNKVVGGLYIGEHVYFQGATARNQALVAAFEVELGKPIKVSRYCHLTGSLGMALLVRDRVAPEKRSRNFKGLEFADQEVNIEYEQCSLCNNLCNLSIIHIGDETVAWGLKCGRDYESKKVRVRKITTYDHWQARQKAWARKIEMVSTQKKLTGWARAMLTARRDILLTPKKIALDLRREGWLVFYDREYNAALDFEQKPGVLNITGPCAVSYSRGDFAFGNVILKGYRVETFMRLKVGVKKFRLRFYDLRSHGRKELANYLGKGR